MGFVDGFIAILKFVNSTLLVGIKKKMAYSTQFDKT
jgi:hypothetical protein